MFLHNGGMLLAHNAFTKMVKLYFHLVYMVCMD